MEWDCRQGKMREIPTEEENMAIWQWALLALALLWGVQSLGVWFQMRHYADVLKGVTSRYTDGFVGAGHVRGRFGKGVIVLIVVDRDLNIRRFLEMNGRTVFAKFKRQEAFEGMALETLRSEPAMEASTPVAQAARQAMEQIGRMAEQSDGTALEGIKAVPA